MIPSRLAFFQAIGIFSLVGSGIACRNELAPVFGTKLHFEIQPQTAIAGAPLAPAVVVTVVDAKGRAITIPAHLVRLQLIDANNPIPPPLLGVSSVLSIDGQATFTDVEITKTGVGYSLLATATDLVGTVSSPFAVNAAPPQQLTFIAQPAGTTAATTLDPVLVEVDDAFGNITSSTMSITITLSGGGGNAHLSGTKTVAAVNGIATFADLSVDAAGNGYKLTVSATNLSGATSAPFDISP